MAKVFFRQCCMLAYSSSSLLSFYCTVAAYVTCCFPAVLSRAAFGQALQLSRSVQMMLSYIVWLGSDQASITAFRRCYLAFLSLGQAFRTAFRHMLSRSVRLELSFQHFFQAMLSLHCVAPANLRLLPSRISHVESRQCLLLRKGSCCRRKR